MLHFLWQHFSDVFYMPPAGNQITESLDHEVQSQDLPVKGETLEALLEPTETLESCVEDPEQTEITDEPVVDLEQSTGLPLICLSMLNGD